MHRPPFHRVLLASLLVTTFTLVAMGGSPKTSAVKSDKDFAVREDMVRISEQLGVTCTHCHDTNNLKSDKMKTWKIAKEHIRVTEVLNSKAGFGGNPKVDCYTCHRGEAVPKLRDEAKASH